MANEAKKLDLTLRAKSLAVELDQMYGSDAFLAFKAAWLRDIHYAKMAMTNQRGQTSDELAMNYMHAAGYLAGLESFDQFQALLLQKLRQGCMPWLVPIDVGQDVNQQEALKE